MSTAAPAGFAPARRILGHPLRAFCDESSEGPCTLVPARPYDRETGYVNAVGPLEIDSAVKSFSTFSSLGEAIFEEIGAGPRLLDLAAPPPVGSVSARSAPRPEAARATAAAVAEGLAH